MDGNGRDYYLFLERVGKVPFGLDLARVVTDELSAVRRRWHEV